MILSKKCFLQSLFLIGFCGSCMIFFLQPALELYIKNYSNRSIFIISRLVKIDEIPLPHTIFDNPVKFYKTKKKGLLYIVTAAMIAPNVSKLLMIPWDNILQTHTITSKNITLEHINFEDIWPHVSYPWELFNAKHTIPELFNDLHDSLNWRIDCNIQSKQLSIMIYERIKNLLISSSDDEKSNSELDTL